MIIIEAKIKFFGIDCGAVEYTCEDYCNSVVEIGFVETLLLDEQRQYCDELGGMPDTFYYETSYLVPESMMETA